MHVSASVYSQKTKLAVSLEDASIEQILKEIKEQSDFNFLYRSDLLKGLPKVTIDFSEATVEEILDKVVVANGFSYEIEDRTVVIQRKKQEPINSVQEEKKEISGKVTDDNGEPLPGVSVMVKGTMIGITSDIEGNFKFQAPKDSEVLVFSFIGMTTKEVAIGANNIFNVELSSSVESIDEVIVVAYGTTKRASFTGSASVVKAEAINKIPVTSVEKALSGTVAGVTVAETSGQPGSYSEIRIRGLGSYSASNSPLYVIDGVAITSGSLTEGGNLMSSIPAGDIESITVLKDAAAATLYGSRAANGVILITTKHGKKGVTKYKVKTSIGISSFAVENYKAAGGDDFVALMRESLENYYGVGHSNVDYYMNRYQWYEPTGGYTDWNDLLFRQGVSKNTEISATGGNEKTQFYISGSFLDQEGLALNSDFMRYTGRINLTHKLSDKLQLGVSVLNAHTDQDVANNGTSYFNPFYNVNRNTWPTESPYDENGEYKYELVNAGYYNLLREYELNEKTAKVFRSMNSGYIEYKPFKSLTFRSTNSYDWINSDYYRYASPLSRDAEDVNGYVYNSNAKRKRLSTSNLLTFEKTFDEKHHLNVIAAFEAEQYKAIDYAAEGEGLPNESLRVLSVTAVPVGASGSESGYSMISYLSRANYDFDNKYYFSGSIRRDGSSRLGINERWANFWSVSGAWRVTSEDFMSDVSFLDDLKLRASYGTSGTLPPGYYDHLALYSYTGAYDGVGAAVENQIASPNLTWEKNKNYNIGFEFGIFDKIKGSVEYFKRHTYDLIMNLPLAPTTGAGSTMVNIGEMENKGLEIELRTNNITSKDFNWSSTFLYTSVRNKILELDGKNQMSPGSYSLRRKGWAYYSFYLPIWAGVDPADGSPMWKVVEHIKDKDGTVIDEIVTDEVTHNYKEAQKAYAGKAEPDFYGSIGNNISYKGFNLSFMFNFSVGGKVWYASGYKSWNDGRSPKYVVPEAQLDRWQKPGDIAAHPQRIWTGNNGSDTYSTRFLLDNDYLRLKDITLSYSLPSSLLRKFDISNVTAYVEGRNMLTFSSQDIVDPEHGGASGYAYFEMPPVKTITFGIEIGF